MNSQRRIAPFTMSDLRVHDGAIWVFTMSEMRTAQAAGRTETALGAFCRRIAARAGKPVAITATAHKLARIVWTMLTKGAAYLRASAASAEERYRQRQIHSLIKRARSFGLQITCPVPSEAS